MNIILAVTGASGALAARLLLEKSRWPVTLVASKMGRVVYEQEVGAFAELETRAAQVWKDGDLTAPIASGSVPTVGMVIMPCSINTLGKVASGLADSLVARTANCQLKERRKVVLCIRETPWTLLNIQNAARVAAAGGTIMPISPPYYMMKGRDPHRVSMAETLGFFIDRVLMLFGQEAPQTWESVR